MRTVIITPGAPGGIGPELVVRHFMDPAERDPETRYLIIGTHSALGLHLDRHGLDLAYQPVDDPAAVCSMAPDIYLYQPPSLQGFVCTPGVPSVEGGGAAGTCLDAAVSLLMDKKADALVTGPLHKAMLQEAGFDFPGHTEFLAERSGTGRENICMHLCGPKLRVSLVTTHPALADVPKLITRERILKSLSLTCDFTRRLGLDAPVAVCGLNPHAGESGKIGREEIDTIIPALEEARSQGMNCEGPFPADTIFHRAASGEFSAVLAMYHDQGLGPLKLMHFSEAVNVTLGLPFVRTSVDHGTAYDLVGKDIASTTSLAAALDLAARLAASKSSASKLAASK